MKSQLKLAMLW